MGFFDFLRKTTGAKRVQTHKQRAAEAKLFGPAPRPKRRYPDLESRRSRGREAGIPDTLNITEEHYREFVEGEYTTVVSSWHMAAQYHAEAELLVINFTRGGGMKVSGVTPAEALSYIAAPSHGMWTHDHVLGRPWHKGGPTLKSVEWF
jgi:hypothetical protein